MKRLIIFLFIIFIFTSIFSLEINSIICPGEGVKLISNSLFINQVGVYNTNTVSSYLLFDKNIKYFDKLDSIFIISDKNNTINVYKTTNTSVQLIDNIYSDSINSIIYADNLIYINKYEKCEAYKYESEYNRIKLINRNNLHLRNIVKFNNTYIALSEDGHNIYTMNIINDTIEFSLQEFLRENSIIFTNNNYLISYSRDRFIYYVVNDSSINYYTAQYLFPDIEEIFYENTDTFIVLEKNKTLFFYSEYSPSYYLLQDSITFSEDIRDVKIINDSIFVLTKNNFYIFDFLYQQIKKESINKNIKDIINYNSSSLVYINDSIFRYDYGGDSFISMDSLSNISYIIDSCMFLYDSFFYIIQNDTFIKHSFNNRIKSVYTADSFIYYSDMNNNIYKYNLNTDINTFLFTINYPVYDLIVNNDTFCITAGYYGLKYYDTLGNILDEEFYSNFLSNMKTKDTLLFISANTKGFYIKHSDSIDYYTSNVMDFYKTDNLFYIITKENIFSYSNNTLEDSIINTGDYHDFLQLSFINDSMGLLLLNKGILLELNNISSGKNEKIFPIDTIYDNSYNCIYDVSGRIVKNGQTLINTTKIRPGIYFIKSKKNKTKKILILK